MYVYGIVAINDIDSSGELFHISGVDATKLPGVYIRRSLDKPKPEDVIGTVHDFKTLFDGSECDHPDEWKLFTDNGKRPCVMVQGQIFDPHYQRLLKAGVALYFGVEGVVLEKQDANLLKTELRGLSLTLHPSHKAYRVRFYP